MRPNPEVPIPFHQNTLFIYLPAHLYYVRSFERASQWPRQLGVKAAIYFSVVGQVGGPGGGIPLHSKKPVISPVSFCSNFDFFSENHLLLKVYSSIMCNLANSCHLLDIFFMSIFHSTRQYIYPLVFHTEH